MTDVQSIVMAAYRLSDENVRLRDQIRWIQRESVRQGPEPPSEEQRLDAKVLEEGRRVVFKTACNLYFRVEFDKGSGDPTPFTDWRERVVRRPPDFMSRDEFKAYFERELIEAYGKAVEEARAEGDR